MVDAATMKLPADLRAAYRLWQGFAATGTFNPKQSASQKTIK
jgi:hypothetical protein